MKKDEWLFVVAWMEGNKKKQREFQRKIDAETFVRKLKVYGKPFNFSRVKRMTAAERLLDAQLRWLGKEVRIWVLAAFILSAGLFGLLVVALVTGVLY